MSDPSPHDASFKRPNACENSVNREIFNVPKVEWDVEDHCSYCGSISVELAIKYLKQPGTKFSGADWKYGWPHKFYLEPVNPDAAELVEIGFSSGWDIDNNPLPTDVWSCQAHRRTPCACPREVGITGHWERLTMGHKKTLYFKFYNKHLADAGPDQLAEFSELSDKAFGITWGKDEKGIFYRAPKANSVYGFQLCGEIDASGQPDHSIMDTLRGK